MIVRIPITKIYHVEIEQAQRAPGGRRVGQAEQLAREMSIDQIEQAGTLIYTQTGRAEVLLPVDCEDFPCTD